MLAFTWLSLKLVAQGYAIALIVGLRWASVLGLSTNFHEDLRPDIFSVLRPYRPLPGCRSAWCSLQGPT
jgi:nitrate/nitrite transport system permease protein